MRLFPLCAAFFLVFLAPALAAAPSNVNRKPGAVAAVSDGQPRFAKAIEDLPLMPGLEIQDDKDVLFIAGPKRIAQTTAAGMVDIDEVYHYYRSSLPQLGWKEIDARTYERVGERLRIEVRGNNPSGLTIARFSVEPVSAGK